MDHDRRQNKTRKIIDDFSTAELLTNKSQSGPRFVFRETDTIFRLTANLRGYKRKDIKVEIDKSGKRVAVMGEKLVHGTTVMWNKVYSKEDEIRSFKRAFHFSDGVIFDKIKARFDEKEFFLTISIPKMERGFRMTCVQEVKEEEFGGTYESLQIEDNVVEERETLKNETHREGDVKEGKKKEEDVANVGQEELGKGIIVQDLDQNESRPVDTFKHERLDGKQESNFINEAQGVEEDDQTRGFEKKEERNIENEGEGEGAKRDESPKTKKDKCKLCNPVILGSTFLMTIAVLVVYFVRTQNPNRKRRN